MLIKILTNRKENALNNEPRSSSYTKFLNKNVSPNGNTGHPDHRPDIYLVCVQDAGEGYYILYGSILLSNTKLDVVSGDDVAKLSVVFIDVAELGVDMLGVVTIGAATLGVPIDVATLGVVSIDTDMLGVVTLCAASLIVVSFDVAKLSGALIVAPKLGVDMLGVVTLGVVSLEVATLGVVLLNAVAHDVVISVDVAELSVVFFDSARLVVDMLGIATLGVDSVDVAKLTHVVVVSLNVVTLGVVPNVAAIGTLGSDPILLSFVEGNFKCSLLFSLLSNPSKNMFCVDIYSLGF